MHIYTLKVSIQSWYCIKGFFFIFKFSAGTGRRGKNLHSAYKALFEATRVIFVLAAVWFRPHISCLGQMWPQPDQSRFRQPGRQAHGGTALAPRHHVRWPSDFLGLINTSRMSCVRDNERYLAFSPAVSQAFLVHSGEVRHKIVGQKKATLENNKFLTYYTI